MNWLKRSNSNPFVGEGIAKRSPRLGFTLAEVLITLGIIGVVAAMTIPNLITGYQKIVNYQKLKQTISILTQAHKMMMEENEASDMTGSGIYNSIDGKRCTINGDMCQGNVYGQINCCGYNAYHRHLKIMKVRGVNSGYSQESIKGYYLNDTNKRSIATASKMLGELGYILMNGVEFMPHYGSKTFVEPAFGSADIYYLIDVNTFDTPPNRYGRDIFAVWVAPDGHLIPQGSAEFAIKVSDNKGKSNEEALATTYYWKNATATSNNGCRKENYTGTGKGCSGRVFEEGKINY